LDSLPDFLDVNRNNYERYRAELAGVPGLRQMTFSEAEVSNRQYIILEIDEDVAGISRDWLLKFLHAENVLARRYFFPGCHRMEPYRSLFPHAGLLLPHTEALSHRVLALPTGTAIGPSEICTICGIIRLVMSHGANLTEIVEPGTRSRSSKLDTRPGFDAPAAAIGASVPSRIPGARPYASATRDA
jgi:dTDP-4-amino-4,6-dideoxygalactose transaminase